MTSGVEEDEADPLDMMVGWFTTIGSKVAMKAKASMDTVITTLDPQMKNLISKILHSILISVLKFNNIKIGLRSQSPLFQNLYQTLLLVVLGDNKIQLHEIID